MHTHYFVHLLSGILEIFYDRIELVILYFAIV